MRSMIQFQQEPPNVQPMSEAVPSAAGECACRGGSTHGTGDPAVRRCDICGGSVASGPGTGEFLAAAGRISMAAGTSFPAAGFGTGD